MSENGAALLPPLSQAGPCRRGCGRELGAWAGPRGKHERHCDGTARTPAARRAARALTRQVPPAAPLSEEAAQRRTRLVDDLRDTAQVLDEAAAKEEAAAALKRAQAKRLREVAAELGTF